MRGDPRECGEKSPSRSSPSGSLSISGSSPHLRCHHEEAPDGGPHLEAWRQEALAQQFPLKKLFWGVDVAVFLASFYTCRGLPSQFLHLCRGLPSHFRRLTRNHKSENNVAVFLAGGSKCRGLSEIFSIIIMIIINRPPYPMQVLHHPVSGTSNLDILADF